MIFLVGTYHKSGTVWMKRTFRDVCEALDIPFDKSIDQQETADWPSGVYLDDHTIFPQSLLSQMDGGFRVVRDPRDVIISGAFYHMKSGESWLHEPQDYLDGKTYQEAINTLSTQKERFLFEMNGPAMDTIKSMAGEGERGRCASYIPAVRYEDLFIDTTTEVFARAIASMGLDNKSLEAARKAFANNSLFSGAKGNQKHIRSGKQEQWKQYFTRDIADKFIELFGDNLIALGYEDSHDWALQLPNA